MVMMEEYYKCTGCGSCVTASFTEDKFYKFDSGFVYAKTAEKCTKCGKVNEIEFEYELIRQGITVK